MKYLLNVLLGMLCAGSAMAASVQTSIDVQAVVATAVSVFVNGNDVTNGSISVSLTDQGGYLKGTTPAFQFIGNAGSVKVTLTSPSSGGLISEKGDVMKLGTGFVRLDGAVVSADYPYSGLPVYASIADVPDYNTGVKVTFNSVQKTETYPLGTYTGTYILMVTPSA